ncbi:MAG: hypothetical protein DYH05_08015 [Acidobacteria bacterium ACB1]|nr:hypothetical protein [Pyrinomonadaceae bacterium]MCE7962428.1 hypothetical protein [Acidobacteria bacterium ACB1]RIJ94023.1 MAG: hypothetical protein DCC44_05655 [Acidobacteriota bacterium]
MAQKHYRSLDTSILLFFLTAELARSATFFGFDTLLLTIAALFVLVLPYLLIEVDGVPAFGRWLRPRLVCAGIGMGSGVLLRFAPEAVGHLPMTFLILSAVICSYIHIYGLLKLRLVK